MVPTTAREGGRSVFSVTHDALKVHAPEGRVTVEYGGKTFHPDLVHNHDH